MRRAALLLFAAVGVASAQPPAAATKPKFLYGHDLKVRTAGEPNFTKDTPKVGVEFFHDPAGNAIVAVSEAGHIAVAPFAEPGASKKADWAFAHELRARGADETTFTKGTKKFGVEVFKDVAGNRLLYVTDQKTIALGDVPAKLEADRDPVFSHGLVLKVRPPADEQFDKAKKIAVEASKDGNTGGLIYVSETGFVAVATAPAKAADDIQPPKPLHGLKLQVRKADEKDFTAATRTVAVEVFEDRNTGGLIYVSETGSVAAVPKPAELKSKEKVKWTHSFVLRARKAGETGFDKAARFGVEAFVDGNTGYTVYASETGTIAVKK